MVTLQDLNAALSDAEMTHAVLVSKLDVCASIESNKEAMQRNEDISAMIEETLNNIDVIKRNILIRERGFLVAMSEGK